MEAVEQEWDANGKPIKASRSPAQHTEWDASGKPITATAPAEPTLLDKAKANFNAATQGAKPGDGIVKSILADIGAGGGDVIRALAHPIDTISNIVSTPDAAMLGLGMLVGDERSKQQAQALPKTGVARTLGQLGTGAIMGDIAGKMAGAVVPRAINAAGDLAGKAALLGKTPEAAYESALKPSTILSQADRAAIVKTGLENEVPVSKGGVQKIGDLIEDLNQKIKDTIASDPNRPIDPNKVAVRADDAKGRFATQVNAQTDLNAIEGSRQQFLDEQGRTPGKPAVSPTPTGILDQYGQPIMNAGKPAIPPTPASVMGAADAQAMKQGTYRVLRGKFGEQGSASVEAQKALARGLKEEIATAFPEVGKMNSAESRLLDLQPVLERAVNRISNHQAIGIGTPVAGVAAEAMTGSPGIGRVAMVLKGVLDNPSVKSRLAIAVSKGAKIPIGQATAKVNAYAASLGAAALGSQENSKSDNPSQSTTTPASQ